jgi:hypothetical protein
MKGKDFRGRRLSPPAKVQGTHHGDLRRKQGPPRPLGGLSDLNGLSRGLRRTNVQGIPYHIERGGPEVVQPLQPGLIGLFAEQCKQFVT